MKRLILKYLPLKSIITVQHLFNYFLKKQVEVLLNSQPNEIKYLSIDDLVSMNSNFDPPPAYGYGIEALHKRGKERSEKLHKLSKFETDMVKTLEIGARDGMASYYLNKIFNKSCTCFDLEPKPVDSLSYGNTEFVKGDVCQLPFENDSFDLAFSFNAFEHFHHPREALFEILRVIRPGGIVYFDFGPIYNAPKGLHLYNKIYVPYCQFLFEFNTLEEYCLMHNLGAPKFNIGKGLNGWSIEHYRNLWKEITSVATIEKYYENPTYKNLKLVNKYPQYFSGKIGSIDDLIITQIQIALKKT